MLFLLSKVYKGKIQLDMECADFVGGGYRKCLKLLYVMMKKFLEKIFIKL